MGAQRSVPPIYSSELISLDFSFSKYMIRDKRPLLEAIDTDDVPAYLRYDCDAIHGSVLKRQAASMGLREVTTAPRSPWQDPYVERVIGSMRRECLDQTIVLGERYLRRVVGNYARYYNDAQTHLSLEKDTPVARPVHRPGSGLIVSRRHCGRLHHEYLRAAA